jgi:hypothetical protein
MDTSARTAERVTPWNKGKPLGRKPPAVPSATPEGAINSRRPSDKAAVGVPQIRPDRACAQRGQFQSLYLAPGGTGPAAGRGRQAGTLLALPKVLIEHNTLGASDVFWEGVAHFLAER